MAESGLATLDAIGYIGVPGRSTLTNKEQVLKYGIKFLSYLILSSSLVKC